MSQVLESTDGTNDKYAKTVVSIQLSKYECCGLKYQDGQTLTAHMRSVHNVGQFTVALSCCGNAFAEPKQLIQHVKAEHGITMDVQI